MDKSAELIGTLTRYNAGLSRDTPANLMFLREEREEVVWLCCLLLSWLGCVLHWGGCYWFSDTCIAQHWEDVLVFMCLKHCGITYAPKQ